MTITILPDNGLGILHKMRTKVSGWLFAKSSLINALVGGHFVRTPRTDCPGAGRRTHPFLRGVRVRLVRAPHGHHRARAVPAAGRTNQSRYKAQPETRLV